MKKEQESIVRDPAGSQSPPDWQLAKCKTGPGIGYKERFLRAMVSLLDTSRGTLWKVAEPVWIRYVEQYVDSGRKGHVGLSINKRKCESITDVLKLLIGTSKPHGKGLVVTGCFGDRSKRTTFFKLRPCGIPFFEAYDEERGCMIRQNPYKKRLTREELTRLDSFLA